MENYEGMTVNERLYHFGLMDEFDKCILERDQNAAIRVLVKVKFNIIQAKETVGSILENPEFYGYK